MGTADGAISETKNLYYANGNLEHVLEPRSFTGINQEVANPALVAEVTATYYADGRMATATNELGATATATYTPDGQVATLTAPPHDSGGDRTTTSYAYDGWGVTSTQVSGDPGAALSVHDLFGEVTATTTPNANTTSLTYWPSGLVDTTTAPPTVSEPHPTVTTDNYDPAGNITSLVQPAGIQASTTVNYTYSALNEILTQSDPATVTHTVGYAYDAGGRQTDRYDLASGVTQTTQATAYDADGRPVTQTSTSTVGGPSFVATAGYDQAGDVTSSASSVAGHAVSSIGIGYTPEGLPKTVSQTLTPPPGVLGSAITKQTSYGYNSDGSLAAEGFDGVTSTYGYDLAGEETSTNPWSGGSFASSYFPSGDRATQTQPDGAVLADSYTSRDLLGSENVSLAGVTLTAYSGLSYDNDAHVTAETVTQQEAAMLSMLGVTVPGGTYTGASSFGYDAQDRLDSYQGPLDPAAASFGLDDAGNVTSAGATTFSYRANQLSSSTAGSSTTTFGYDPEGNQTSVSVPGLPGPTVTTTSYDAAFHPYQITSTATVGATTNLYDALGRQVMVELPTGGLQMDFYAGATDQIEEEVDTAAGVTTTTTHYLLDSSAGPLGQNVSGGSSPGTSYDVFDPRGDVTQVLSSSGVVMNTYGYDPFGNPASAQTTAAPGTLGPVGSKLQFQSAPLEPGTGEYAIGPRLYNPQITRFAGADLYASSAAGLATQVDPLTGNAYLYAGANPAGLIDDGYGPCLFGHVHGSNSACRASRQVNELSAAGRRLNPLSSLRAPTSVSAVAHDAVTILGASVEAPTAINAVKGAAHDVSSTYQECASENWAHCALGVGNIALQVGLLIGTDGGSEEVEAGVEEIEAASAAETEGAAAGASGLEPTAGQTIFRVYGGDSTAGGASWSPVNPGDVGDFRDAAGLPSGGASGATNTGQFVIEGTLNDPAAVALQRNALALDGLKGGMPEYIIPNWMENGSITINRVSGVNPEF